MPGYKKTDIGLLPEEWNAVPLYAIGWFKNGINKGSESFGHGSPFVNLMDVFGVNKIDSDEGLGLVETTDSEQKTYCLKLGDVLFIRSSVKPSGVGLTAVIEKDISKSVYSGFLLRFRDEGVLDTSFKKYCFYSEIFRRNLINASSVSANTNINQDNLKKLLLALPPTKKEQHAIASALSDADALLDSLDRLIAKKRDLKQAAMQQLLTGQTRLPGFSGEWEVKRLGDVAILKNGYAFKSNTYSNLGAFHVITIANVQDGFMETESCNKISSEPPDLQPHQRLSRGDILISMTGNVGRVCHVNEDNCLLNQRVGKLVPVGLSETFLFLLLRQASFTSAMADVAKGGAQPNLSASDITNYLLHVPTELSEQAAICDMLTVMNEEIEMLGKRRKKTAALKQGMMQELLTGRTRLV